MIQASEHFIPNFARGPFPLSVPSYKILYVDTYVDAGIFARKLLDLPIPWTMDYMDRDQYAQLIECRIFTDEKYTHLITPIKLPGNAAIKTMFYFHVNEIPVLYLLHTALVGYGEGFSFFNDPVDTFFDGVVKKPHVDTAIVKTLLKNTPVRRIKDRKKLKRKVRKIFKNYAYISRLGTVMPQQRYSIN